MLTKFVRNAMRGHGREHLIFVVIRIWIRIEEFLKHIFTILGYGRAPDGWIIIMFNEFTLRVGHGSLFQNPTQPQISGPNPTHKSLHPTQPNPSSTLGMAY